MKLLTLNIQQYAVTHGRWQERRDHIADLIATSAPDVVALQAVAWRPEVEAGMSQAEQLVGRLRTHQHALYVSEPDNGGALGQAILARFPLQAHETILLSRRSGIEDTQRRLVLHTAFGCAGGVLHIFNCHFSWIPEQCADNVREALPWIGGFAGPRVILGDLNAEPGSAAMRSIAEARFIDAWPSLHPAEPGLTFPSNDPKLRIDYAWCDAAAAATLRSAQVVGRPGAETPDCLSDHLGLLVELDL